MDKEVKVVLPAWILERRIAVLYVIDDAWLQRDLLEVIQIAPGKEFYELVANHINTYLRDGTLPPAEIAPAILNLIDDQKSGRNMTLRAGDYISLQNYLRKVKK